jgi:hypothetical protein
VQHLPLRQHNATPLSKSRANRLSVVLSSRHHQQHGLYVSLQVDCVTNFMTSCWQRSTSGGGVSSSVSTGRASHYTKVTVLAPAANQQSHLGTLQIRLRLKLINKRCCCKRAVSASFASNPIDLTIKFLVAATSMWLHREEQLQQLELLLSLPQPPDILVHGPSCTGKSAIVK